MLRCCVEGCTYIGSDQAAPRAPRETSPQFPHRVEILLSFKPKTSLIGSHILFFFRRVKGWIGTIGNSDPLRALYHEVRPANVVG
ncbi:hypothetical protein BT93_J1334 [Corymbia citriodora subsp. variegata]|nr:hypothetical protein BT93_J1334 [Corymbia citriodora subsp. variegata]